MLYDTQVLALCYGSLRAQILLVVTQIFLTHGEYNGLNVLFTASAEGKVWSLLFTRSPQAGTAEEGG